MSDMAAELRRIADQIERWARYDDVPPPGLPDAETLRQAATCVWPGERFQGLPYGWIQGRDGIAAVLVILDRDGGDPSPEVAGVLAQLALRNAEDARTNSV